MVAGSPFITQVTHPATQIDIFANSFPFCGGYCLAVALLEDVFRVRASSEPPITRPSLLSLLYPRSNCRLRGSMGQRPYRPAARSYVVVNLSSYFDLTWSMCVCVANDLVTLLSPIITIFIP